MATTAGGVSPPVESSVKLMGGFGSSPKSRGITEAAAEITKKRRTTPTSPPMAKMARLTGRCARTGAGCRVSSGSAAAVDRRSAGGTIAVDVRVRVGAGTSTVSVRGVFRCGVTGSEANVIVVVTLSISSPSVSTSGERPAATASALAISPALA